MKRIFNNINRGLRRGIKYFLILASLFAGFYSCKEQPRFEIGYSDSEPPGMPGVRTYRPLYGGAMIYFTPPADKDVLTVDASYVNEQGKEVWFSASYFKDSVGVYGFSDTLEKIVNVYAVDRAGNRSEPMPVAIYPLEPAYTRVARSIVLKSGFLSFFLEWKNEIRQNINVYLDISYMQNGERKERSMIHTSNLLEEQWFVRDLDLTENDPVSVKVRVEDPYGNITDVIDKGEINLMVDEKIPKDKWKLPDAGDYISEARMGYFAYAEGRPEYIIDDIIDNGNNLNYGHTGGGSVSGIVPWNVLIDLGDEYEISRIITWQKFGSGNVSSTNIRGDYYGGENPGIYDMYIMDEKGEWEFVRRHTIPQPMGLSDMEYRQMGMAGDMAYLYTDEPHFSKPTRWFRYEARYGFSANGLYDNTYSCNNISEITLYGRKAKK
jgi:hypothetical protein